MFICKLARHAGQRRAGRPKQRRQLVLLGPQLDYGARLVALAKLQLDLGLLFSIRVRHKARRANWPHANNSDSGHCYWRPLQRERERERMDAPTSKPNSFLVVAETSANQKQFNHRLACKIILLAGSPLRMGQFKANVWRPIFCFMLALMLVKSDELSALELANKCE